MLRTFCKTLCFFGLSCLSLSTAIAADWRFVGGSGMEPFEHKNIDERLLDHLPSAGMNSSSVNSVALAVGDSVTVCQHLSNLAPGFYDVSATVSTSSLNAVCYLFGKGTGYSLGSTLVPVGDRVRVKVRSVGTADGCLFVGLFSDGSQKVEVSDLRVEPVPEFRFLQGGDITELNYVLDNGGRYADENGVSLCGDGLSREEMAQNVLNYLARNGMNFVRIRLTNNPGQPDNTKTYYLPEGYQDESDCLQLAKMASDAGMEIQFTFNWSDYWSNGTRQNVPADWLDAVKNAGAGKEVETLANCAYNYTKRVMQNLAELNIYPAYVSLGNETNGGFLFPYAYAYDVPASEASADMPQGYKNWSAIAKVVNAGYQAVKEVSPNSQVVIHLADNTYDVVDKADHVDWWVYSWYFDELNKAGAKYDVIGASYYPSWSTATAAQAAQFYNQLVMRYNKDILVMETGYNWTGKKKDGSDGQLPYTAPEYKSRFPFSKGGQKGFVADVLNELKSVNAGGHHVVGDLYWDPLMIHVEDAWGKNATGWANWWQWKTPDANVVENTTLFDFDGRALPVFDAYRHNRNSLPLRQFAVSLNGDASLDVGHAFYGDSVRVRWENTDDYYVDTVVVSPLRGNPFVYPVSDSANQFVFEMPQNDVTVEVHRSPKSQTIDLTVGIDIPLEVVSQSGGLLLESPVDSLTDVYAVSGVLVRSVALKAGEPVFCPLSAGVYMVAGKKHVVR